MLRTLLISIAMWLGLVMSASAQKAEIDMVNKKWMELFNKGDFDAIAQLYTEDAVLLPPGSPLIKGRAAIGAMWRSMAEQVVSPNVSAVDVKALGLLAAREIGVYSLKTKGANPQELTGKYVVIWERVGATGSSPLTFGMKASNRPPVWP